MTSDPRPQMGSPPPPSTAAVPDPAPGGASSRAGRPSAGRPPAGRSSGGRRPGGRPTPLPEGLQAVFAEYERSVAAPGTPLNADTVRVYASRVRQYLAWLATGLDSRAPEGDPLRDPDARDRAAQDYRTHLQTVGDRKPATINAHLTAIDDFYRRRGLGPAATERAGLPPAAPRALDEHDQIRLIREADRAPLRDMAIAYTAFYTGTRISEIAGLDTDDVDLSAGNGHLIVRYGKNGKYRQVPLHPKVHTVLERWIRERAGWKGGDTSGALFLNRRGGRLSARSTYTVLRGIADAAGLPLGRDGLFTPRVLRHTAGTTMARRGADIVIVADILGHSVDIARRYNPLSDHDRRQAIERLTADE